jgi:hypothetical protein
MRCERELEVEWVKVFKPHRDIDFYAEDYAKVFR